MPHYDQSNQPHDAVQMHAENGFEGMAQAMQLLLNKASLLRLVTAILVELSDDWETGMRYLTMQSTD